MRGTCSREGRECHEWHAAIYLAELALTHPKLFDNRRVVELGSGMRGRRDGDGERGDERGVRAWVRPSGAPSRLVLTDADAGALANLERNLAANDVRVERYSNDESNDDDRTSHQTTTTFAPVPCVPRG